VVIQKHKNNEEINYQLARAHSLNANPEKALNVLDGIAKTDVKSNSYTESQFRRGEAYFVRKQYQVAEEAYGQVIQQGDNSEFYDKALYKRGWSFFKQSLFDEALSDFFDLYTRLVFQQNNNQTQNKLLTELSTDTLRVIGLSFYNMEGVNSIKAYFEKSGSQNFEDKVYEALAQLYIDQERYKDAADTYLGFIDRNPLSLASPDFHSQVIDIYKKAGFPSLILPAKESFVVKYGVRSEFWKNYSGKVIDDLRPLLQEHLQDISTFYHAKSQKSKKRSDYLIAADWYRQLLASIDINDLESDSKYRFLLAEVLSDGKDYPSSGKEYEVVAYKNPASQFSRDAGYRALVAYQQIIYPDTATPLEKLLPSIQSGEKFSETFQNDAKAPEILARVAEQQLMIQDVVAAMGSSRKLLLLPAQITEQQKNRANIIIANGLFDLKRYQEAEVAINQALTSKSLGEKEKANLKQRRVESVYKLAESAQAANKLPEAIDLFLKVKQLEPLSEVAANAHFDAATLFIQLEKWSDAVQLLNAFRNDYPSHKLAQSIPEKLVLIHEKKQNWEAAADEYKRLANLQKDPELAREGHWKVAELYLKAKKTSKAVEAFKYYVWTYPLPYLFSQEGRYHLVKLYNDASDKTESLFWRQKLVESYRQNKSNNNERTTFLAAESQFILSEDFFKDFQSIKLNLPLKNSLKRKRAAMTKALDAYNGIAQFKVAQFTTASTHKVARIYQILSDDLMDSQKPQGLNEEELEEYGFLLEEQALPFEDKAINYFEINAQRTKGNIYDDSVRSSIESLKKLKPAQYDKSERLKELLDVNF